jgi:hypothetical protein
MTHLHSFYNRISTLLVLDLNFWWNQKLRTKNTTSKDVVHFKQKKVNNTALDFAVPTSGADLRFMALQPGSEMGVGGQKPLAVLGRTEGVLAPCADILGAQNFKYII